MSSTKNKKIEKEFIDGVMEKIFSNHEYAADIGSKVIKYSACDYCGALKGKPCFVKNDPNKLTDLAHVGRRREYIIAQWDNELLKDN